MPNITHIADTYDPLELGAERSVEEAFLGVTLGTGASVAVLITTGGVVTLQGAVSAPLTIFFVALFLAHGFLSGRRYARELNAISAASAPPVAVKVVTS